MQLSHGQRREHRFSIIPLVRVRNPLRPLASNDHCLESHYLATSLQCYNISWTAVILNQAKGKISSLSLESYFVPAQNTAEKDMTHLQGNLSRMYVEGPSENSLIII
jgi:hypothetical protein